MSREALIIVDVQNDFCPGGSLPVPEGDKIIDSINYMIDWANIFKWYIAFTQDWHPEKTTHFAKYGGIWPEHCIQNTKGAELHPKLKMPRGKSESGYSVVTAHFFKKGMGETENSYSGFDGKGLWNLSLDEFLKIKGSERLYICGLATDYCVKETALDATINGYETYLLKDATAAVNINSGDEERAIEEMVRAGVILTDTESVVKSR